MDRDQCIFKRSLKIIPIDPRNVWVIWDGDDDAEITGPFTAVAIAFQEVQDSWPGMIETRYRKTKPGTNVPYYTTDHCIEVDEDPVEIEFPILWFLILPDDICFWESPWVKSNQVCFSKHIAVTKQHGNGDVLVLLLEVLCGFAQHPGVDMVIPGFLAALLAGEAYFAAVLFALARALTQPGF